MAEIEQKSFEPVKEEVFELLVSLFCYESKLQGLGGRLPNYNRRFFLEELVALRLISNEIIMQICKLDQDTSGMLSLHSVRKALFKEPYPEAWKRKLSSKLSYFRSDIGALKTAYRNAYIAHRTKEKSRDPFGAPNLTTMLIPVITQAVDILDYMWGGQIAYGYNLGGGERLNLRDPLRLPDLTAK